MKHVVTALLCAFLVGCAGVSAVEIDDAVPGRRDSDVRGIRYYLPAPHILVYSNGPGRLTAQLYYLPDTTRVMSVDPYSVLAANNSELKFQNGMLVSGSSVADSTVIPAAALDALKAMALATVDAALESEEEQANGVGQVRSLPPPYLFRIVVDADGTWLIGGEARNMGDTAPAQIRVNVIPGATAATTPAAAPAAGATGGTGGGQ